MKLDIFFFAVVSLNAFCQSSPEKPLEVIESSEQNVNGRRVVIQQIVAPAPSDPAPRSGNTNKRGKSVEKTEKQKDQLPQRIFIVSTTIYDEKISHVKWWPMDRGSDEALECWSNINWSDFGSSHQFNSKEAGYSILHFSTSVATEGENGEEIALRISPPKLPLRDAAKAQFQLLKNADRENKKEDLKFMRDIHRYHQLNLNEIQQTRLDQEVAKDQADLEREMNPPEKKDGTIRFWKNEPQSEIQQPTK